MLQSLKNLGRFKAGDKIGFSALIWSTNVMPIIQMEFIPEAIDCTKETLNVMPGNLPERLKEVKLNALFVTNVLVFCGDIENIQKICRGQGTLLIEDNCESLGTIIKGKKTGNFGAAANFSFFVAHHISTIEGGMICTNDEYLVEMLRIVRANGWDRNLSAKQAINWKELNSCMIAASIAVITQSLRLPSRKKSQAVYSDTDDHC